MRCERELLRWCTTIMAAVPPVLRGIHKFWAKFRLKPVYVAPGRVLRYGGPSRHRDIPAVMNDEKRASHVRDRRCGGCGADGRSRACTRWQACDRPRGARAMRRADRFF